MAAFVINRHPQPIDDCPCFEDAVAFVAVLLGSTVSKWFIAQFDGLEEEITFSRMPGSSMETWGDILTLSTFSALKMVVGTYDLASLTCNFFANPDMQNHRYTCRFRLASTRKNNIPHDSSSLLPLPRAALHTPSSALLHSSYGLYFSPTRERLASNPVCS